MPQKPTPIQVVTWNVAHRDVSVLDALQKAMGRTSHLDLLTLQEVGPNRAEDFRDRLVKMDLKHVYYAAHLDLPCLCEVNVIGSRWPLDATELRYPRKELPWPQALTRVSVSVNGPSIFVVTAHIPNGTRHGWEKIDTFKVLNKLVLQAMGTPSIVTGDFNEPRYHRLVNGHILTWGQEDNSPDYWEECEIQGRTGKGQDWDEPIRWLFEKVEEHALRNAYREAHGKGAMDVSHVTTGKKRRWFDHMFVSPHFCVEQCEYLHKLRGPGLSDHSALKAKLLLKA